VSRRARIWSYGSVGVVMFIGVLCRVIVGGFVGEITALTLLSLGAGAILVLVFIEVGLSEDRERAKEEAERSERAPAPTHRPPRPRSRPRRPS
jgi:hypothetical protein